jgi:drug/metabolite transporter (DMT)-like permease
VSVLVGLLASVSYGLQDFIGGLVSRRNHVFTVVFWGQVVGVPFAGAGIPFLTDGPPAPSALWFGGAAGVVGMFGAAFLFRGLARGRMSVVAPVTGLLAAALPVVVALLTGERPSRLSLGGLLLALAAIVLVSTAPEPGPRPEAGSTMIERMMWAGLPEGLAAGTCFAGFFLLLDRVPDDAGVWPIVAARVAGLVVMGGVVLAIKIPVRPAKGTAVAVIGAGLLSNVSDYLFVIGTRLGLLSVVVVLTSLYPVTTVVLARTVLKERIGRIQLVGLVLAAIGVVLITTG